MKHGRVDANQPDIVQKLRDTGHSVLCLGNFGLPVDVLVGRNGKNMLMEIKDENQPPSKRKLTDDEQKFQDEWKGQVANVKNFDEALAVMNEVVRKEGR